METNVSQSHVLSGIRDSVMEGGH